MEAKILLSCLLLGIIILSGCTTSNQQSQSPQTNPQPSSKPNPQPQPSPQLWPLPQPNPQPEPQPISQPQTYNVNISNYSFNPEKMTINAGDTVVWTNNDSVVHPIVSGSSELQSGQLAQGKTYSHTFSTPGTYNYHCSIHLTMTGTITVQ
jgi:plastocyanin